MGPPRYPDTPRTPSGSALLLWTPKHVLLLHIISIILVMARINIMVVVRYMRTLHPNVSSPGPAGDLFGWRVRTAMLGPVVLGFVGFLLSGSSCLCVVMQASTLFCMRLCVC